MLIGNNFLFLAYMKIEFKCSSRYLLLLFLTVLFLSSCISNKRIVYFSDPGFEEGQQTTIDNKYRTAYHLQKRDVLSVRIKTLDSESSSYFNIENAGTFMNLNPASMFLNGYSIDDRGNIEIPEVGLIAVEGLTVNEAQEKIQKVVSNYLTKATILVKLVSFKVTVLGEVRNPGTQYVYNDQLTILEAIGMCGDITDFGNREHITLLRQTATGQKAVILNLKETEILSSEYLYMQPNDVVYIQPLRAKATRGNLGTLSIASLVLGIISTAILISNSIN
jgi:polysaccharide export outer membrane protein